MGILLSRCPQPKSRCYHAPIRLGEVQGGSVATPQSDRQREAIIPQTEGDDGDEGEEDGRKEDAELEQEGQEHPPLEGGAVSEEV